MAKSSPEFIALMKFLRERAEVSARELSLNSGLSQGYVSKMEQGNVTPTVEVFSKIVQNLGVSAAELTYLIKVLAETKEGDE